jgi:DNA invertase Pin-like site-specific DNA recombinase
MTIYGYARISTKKQSLQRQINNIEAYNKDAIIYEEEFTGRKVEGRKEFQKLLKKVKANDTIIFDSVSRMSRNADEGIKLYMDLFDRGVNLIFLNEMHINTDTYRKQIEQANIPTTDNTIVNMILEGVVNALKELAKEQIKIAFEQSQKEVDDLSIRTSKGIEAKRKEAEKNNKEFKIGSKSYY